MNKLLEGDYYPFGMGMPGREYSLGEKYKYGFNGQEKSSEIDPGGNSMSADFWQYDSRVGRRWNTDPVVKEYESPYLTFGNSPIWIIDHNGADSVPVHNRIIDKDGNQVTTPTIVDLSASRINPKQYPGMKVVGHNRVEVTPGDFMAEFAPTDGSNTQTFTQVPKDIPGGTKFTWTADNSNGVLPPPPAVPTMEYNNQITGTANIFGPLAPFVTNLSIPFFGATTNPSVGDAARFSNPGTGIPSMQRLVNRLRNRGITNGVTITIGTDFQSTNSPSNQYGTSGGLLAARGRYVRSFFGGIATTLSPPATGTTAQITIAVNANTIGIVGWNITTQLMQRQNLNGAVVPGSVRPVPGAAPVTTPQTGGTRPAVGTYTGPWRTTQ